jgi:hypothetical protein
MTQYPILDIPLSSPGRVEYGAELGESRAKEGILLEASQSREEALAVSLAWLYCVDA